MTSETNNTETLSNEQVPFFIVYKPVFEMALKANELVVYCALLYYSNSETSVVFPSYKTLARRAGVSERTAQRAIPVLAERGLISIKRQYDTEKQRFFANHYTILPVEGGGVTESPPGVRESLGVVSESPNKDNHIEKDKKKDVSPNGDAPPKKPKTNKGEIDFVFNTIVQGSFNILANPDDRYDGIVVPGGRVGKIKAAVKKAYSEATDEELVALLEAGYKLYLQKNPEIKTDPTLRLKAPDTVVDWVQMAQRANVPVKSDADIRADYSLLQQVYAENFGDNPQRIDNMSDEVMRSALAYEGIIEVHDE